MPLHDFTRRAEDFESVVINGRELRLRKRGQIPMPETMALQESIEVLGDEDAPFEERLAAIYAQLQVILPDGTEEDFATLSTDDLGKLMELAEFTDAEGAVVPFESPAEERSPSPETS